MPTMIWQVQKRIHGNLFWNRKVMRQSVFWKVLDRLRLFRMCMQSILSLRWMQVLHLRELRRQKQKVKWPSLLTALIVCRQNPALPCLKLKRQNLPLQVRKYPQCLPLAEPVTESFIWVLRRLLRLQTKQIIFLLQRMQTGHIPIPFLLQHWISLLIVQHSVTRKKSGMTVS